MVVILARDGRLVMAAEEIRVLVVDDSMAVSAGWEVVGEASNGQEAIDRYRELQPDAVTLDLVMPEHDGLHALHGIMAFDSEAKVLVVSALEQRGVLKDAIKVGASDFVAKPFAKRSLAATLEQLVPHNKFICPGVDRLSRTSGSGQPAFP
jgi:two-component system chemotaxis response regulator CheY